MNKFLPILSLVLLTACGPSQEEREKVAAVTCSIMSETRNMDAAIRVEKMNEARDKIGGEPFLRGDDVIQEAIKWGLCQQLVLNEPYEERLQSLKDAERERERIAAEKRAEENRIAAEKQRIAAEKRAEENRIRIAAEKQRITDRTIVKEEFHSNGKLKSRTTYQSKADGGKKHGLQESYYENGQLQSKRNYKDGIIEDGPTESYDKNGQLLLKQNFKDGKLDGFLEWYLKNELYKKICYKNDKITDMSYCKK